MKKVVCFIFIFLMFLSIILFKNQKIDDFLAYFDNISSLKVVVDDDCGVNGVFNGNQKIIELIDKIDINDIDFKGISVKINEIINLKQFFNAFDIFIDKYYEFENICVWEGFFKNISMDIKNTIQIVIKNNSTIIGIPAILDSF